MSVPKKTKIIVSIEKTTGAIGANGNLFYSIKGDLVHFRRTTMTTTTPQLQNVLVMGRKTWESLPKKPLPNRINVVFSTNPIDGVDVVGSMREYHEYIVAHSEKIENVYIIGGSSIYNMFLESGLVDEIICTVFYPKRLNEPIERVADTFFPIHELQRFVNSKSEYIGEDDNYVAIVEYYVN